MPSSVLQPPPAATDSGFAASVDRVTEAQWHELLEQFDDASIYQTWSYGAVLWGAKHLSHLVLHRGGEAAAIAQVRIVRLPVLGKGIAYVRWGPLCRRRGAPPDRDREVLAEALRALKAEYVQRRGLLLRVIPNAYDVDAFAPTWRTMLQAEGLVPDPAAHVYRTMRVDLDQPLDDLRKGLGSRWRNYLKNAEKSAYAVVEGSSVELYERFLVLYRQMMARKQFETTVDVEDFRRLQEALPEQFRMRVFLCEKEGRTLNALVVSHVGDTGIYLLAATGDEGLKERGAHLLQWRALEWLKSRGCRWYDVGGINPDRNPGVYQFKSGLGGGEVRQLGGFRLSAGWLNSAIVGTGERLRACLAKLKR